MTTRTIAVVVLALVVVGLTIWLVPTWQVKRWRDAGVEDEEKLAELSVQARSSITQAFGGLALVATLAITAFQVSETRRSSENTLRLAERGQAAERFSKAVEQLGATNAEGEPAVDVRTGALFSLRAIALDSKDLAEPAAFIVASYVRNNYARPAGLEAQKHGCARSPTVQSTDVSTALRLVLPDVSEELLASAQDPDTRGLRGADLGGLGVSRLKLTRFDLTQIRLPSAKLQAADFRESTLAGGTLDSACLKGASLRDANLRDASMVKTNLADANLESANLADANLEGANLADANLESANLADANLADANLEGANLADANLADANLANAELKGATLSKRTLEHAALSRKQRDEIVVL